MEVSFDDLKRLFTKVDGAAGNVNDGLDLTEFLLLAGKREEIFSDENLDYLF